MDAKKASTSKLLPLWKVPGDGLNYMYSFCLKKNQSTSRPSELSFQLSPVTHWVHSEFPVAHEVIKKFHVSFEVYVFRDRVITTFGSAR